MKFGRKRGRETSGTENHTLEKCVYVYKVSLHTKAYIEKLYTATKINTDLILYQYMCCTQKSLSSYYDNIIQSTYLFIFKVLRVDTHIK